MEAREEVTEKLAGWMKVLEERGFRLNRGKMEYMCCMESAKQERDLGLGEIIFRRVDEFRYLGVIVKSDRDVEREVGNRMQAG